MRMLPPLSPVSVRGNTLPPDPGSKQWPKPVPPDTHRSMADVDASFIKQFLDLSVRQGKRTCIVTARRMISGDVLKSWEGFFNRKDYEPITRHSRNFAPTVSLKM
jgi:hypothetical protein